MIQLPCRRRFSYCCQSQISFRIWILVDEGFLYFLGLLSFIDFHLMGLFCTGWDWLIYELAIALTFAFIPMPFGVLFLISALRASYMPGFWPKLGSLITLLTAILENCGCIMVMAVENLGDRPVKITMSSTLRPTCLL